MQNAVFYPLKDGILRCNKWPFRKQKVAYWINLKFRQKQRKTLICKFLTSKAVQRIDIFRNFAPFLEVK